MDSPERFEDTFKLEDALKTILSGKDIYTAVEEGAALLHSKLDAVENEKYVYSGNELATLGRYLQAVNALDDFEEKGIPYKDIGGAAEDTKEAFSNPKVNRLAAVYTLTKSFGNLYGEPKRGGKPLDPDVPLQSMATELRRFSHRRYSTRRTDF